MRILLITFGFPPYNSVGSIRPGKMAKYLFQHGNDVRVLTTRNLPNPTDLPVEIPEELILRVKWIDLYWLQSVVERMRGKRVFVQTAAAHAGKPIYQFTKHLFKVYRTLFVFPDQAIGWFPFAIKAAHSLFESWQPDIILASSPHPTTLLLAARLGRQFCIPWVGDFRDLWTDDGYYSFSKLRIALDAYIERRTVRTARGLVTISEPLAEILRWRYGKPTEVVLNGFDIQDYPTVRPTPSNTSLSIVYTGSVIEGYRNPEPLFAALSRLGKLSEQIRVHFYGKVAGTALIEAHKYGMGHLVKCHGHVPYHESLYHQCSADLLLLLLWNDPRERGTYTSKLFEYLGARRPILGIGPKDNVAAHLIHERRAGLVSLDPEELATYLLRCLDEKRRNGYIPDTPASVTEGLSREEQTYKLEAFLEHLINCPAKEGHN